MRKPPISTILGWIAICLGGGWICTVLIIPGAHGAFTGRDAVLAVLFFSLLSLPGVLSAYWGYRLVREKTVSNFIRVMVLLAVVAAVALAFLLSIHSPLPLNARIASNVYNLIAVLISVPLYAYLTAFLMCRDGLPSRDPWTLVKRWAVFIAALQIYCISSGLFDLYAPGWDGMRHLHSPGWELLAFVVSIGSAVAFYKLTLYLLRTPSGEPPPQGISSVV